MTSPSSPVVGDMVEAVARAIFDAENGLDGDRVGTIIHNDFRIRARDGDRGIGDTMTVCRAAARAAIEAMREPTEAMIDAYCATHERLGFTSWANASTVLPAMIDAALSPPLQQGTEPTETPTSDASASGPR